MPSGYPAIPRQGLLLCILGTVWGLQITLLASATGAGADETGLLLLSMVILAAILLATLALQGHWFLPTWRHLRFFAISGCLGFVLPLGAVLVAAHHVSAGEIVLLESLTPVFTLAITMALGSERATGRRLEALLVGLLSVALALAPAAAAGHPERLLGLAVALVVPVAYALDGLYVASRWPTDLRPLQVVAGEAVAGALGLLPFWLWSIDGHLNTAAWTTSHWSIVLLAPISCLEVYLYFDLLRRSGAVFVSLSSFIGLTAGIAWGILLLGETHPPSTWLAAGLAMLALHLALRPDRAGAIRLARQPAACSKGGPSTAAGAARNGGGREAGGAPRG